MRDNCCKDVHILVASNIFWWTLDEFMTEFGFSGWISRVHFVVNLLLITVAVVACSIRWLHTVFLSLSSRISWSVSMLTLSFLVFYKVTRLEIGFWILFFVVDRAVTLLSNVMFSLVLIGWLAVVAHCFDFGSSLWRFWMAVGDGRSSWGSMIVYVDMVL